MWTAHSEDNRKSTTNMSDFAKIRCKKQRALTGTGYLDREQQNETRCFRFVIKKTNSKPYFQTANTHFNNKARSIHLKYSNYSISNVGLYSYLLTKWPCFQFLFKKKRDLKSRSQNFWPRANSVAAVLGKVCFACYPLHGFRKQWQEFFRMYGNGNS